MVLRLGSFYQVNSRFLPRFKNLMVGASVCYGCYRAGVVHSSVDDTTVLETFVNDFFGKESGSHKRYQAPFLQEEAKTHVYAKFVGDYELRGTVAKIVLQQDILYAQSVGGSSRELVPITGNEFSVKNHPEYTVRFMVDEEKRVSSAQITKKIGPWFSVSATAYPKKSRV